MSIDYNDTVSCIMVHVITVSKDAKILEAMKIMVKHGIGSLVVTEKKKGIGIITERDVMKAASTNPEKIQQKVKEIMSTPLITITEETPVWNAFRIMIKSKIRRLPIEKKGKIIGIVAERDLFRWVMQVVYGENLPDDIKSIVIDGYPKL